jgi:two-component system phosphate regulon sensor histidine kinase PhoR
MTPRDLYRLIPAAVGASGAGALTIGLGAPFLAALPALFAGGAAAWLFTLERTSLPGDPAEPSDPFDVARPIFAELLHSFGDPLLLTERQQVTMANAAALDLLGAHIIGEDVRLAIRHPLAAERLTGGADGSRPREPIELVGIGEADRHWQMSLHELGQQRRLVRLSDRTSQYVAEKMRVDFVANSSHELRTPLATLIGFIETLEDDQAGADKTTRERFLGIMSDEARRMQRLIDDLISLSRIEADKFSPPDTAVALAPLVREVIDAALAGVDDDGTERIRLKPIAGSLQVKGDRAQLSQLLHNLVGNAIKYGRPGTSIMVSAEAIDGGMIRIIVADQGDGIAPEHLPRLTERFYRVDPGRSRAMGGTGLGLAIVKHIVERHRGQLTIKSEVGVGTTVGVLLPAA